MASFTVIYDACLFYPAPLRDMMIRLARTRRFRARWTERIHEEWFDALLLKRPNLSRDRLSTIERINSAVPDCLVSGYERMIDRLVLPDPGDRHVPAAAIRAGAGAIVTMNTKDFPDNVLNEFGVFARHPDDFILDLADLEPAVVIGVAKEQRADLRHPPYSPEEFAGTIRSQGLPGVASFLEDNIVLI